MQAAEPTVTAKPRGRDPRATRERILSTAYKEFAVRGYDGACFDAIVARCKISKNLLYHYFSGKAALFIEVMERDYRAISARTHALALSGQDRSEASSVGNECVRTGSSRWWAYQ